MEPLAQSAAKIGLLTNSRKLLTIEIYNCLSISSCIITVVKCFSLRARIPGEIESTLWMKPLDWIVNNFRKRVCKLTKSSWMSRPLHMLNLNLLDLFTIPIFIFIVLYCFNPKQQQWDWAFPSFHRWRGEVHPWQAETRIPTFTPMANFDSPVNLTCMPLDCRRKSEYQERIHAGTGRTFKLPTEHYPTHHLPQNFFSIWINWRQFSALIQEPLCEPTCLSSPWRSLTTHLLTHCLLTSLPAPLTGFKS